MGSDQGKHCSDVDTEPKLDRCPRKLEFVMLHKRTGEIRPARCRANTCPWCGPVNAALVGGAITLADPERWGTLTLVGDDWQLVRARMRRLTYRLRSSLGGSFEWCWHVEPNPKGTGHHVHFWQRGVYVPQRLLSDLCRSEGMGRVCEVKRWRPSTRATVYGVKLAGVGYGLKLADAEESMRGYLDINGNRLVHASRGFWRDRSGEHVGQREAMASWVKRADESETGDWEMVRKSAPVAA